MTNNISDKNLVLGNPDHISEHFNNHFSSIPKKKLKKKFHNQRKSFTDYLKQPLENTFLINLTTIEDDAESDIKTLKINKASGPNSIPTKIFKTFHKPLSKPLANQINLFLAQENSLLFLKQLR